jgi:hypothetical protein
MNNTNPVAHESFMDAAAASGATQRFTSSRWVRGLLASTVLMSMACLPGCSSNYVIHTADGKTYQTQGAPQLTDGGYAFTDSNGQRQQLYLSQVTKVRQP